jgi:hypothetical protein
VIDEMDDLTRMYVDERLSIRQIANRTGCTYYEVRAALLADGVRLRPKGIGPMSHRRKEIDVAEAKRLYVEAGLTLEDVAAKLGCSESTVRNRLVAAEVPLRRRGGWSPRRPGAQHGSYTMFETRRCQCEPCRAARHRHRREREQRRAVEMYGPSGLPELELPSDDGDGVPDYK